MGDATNAGQQTNWTTAPDSMIESAWGLIASAICAAEREEPAAGWLDAAQAWRDRYHLMLDEQRVATPANIGGDLIPAGMADWKATLTDAFTGILARYHGELIVHGSRMKSMVGELVGRVETYASTGRLFK